MTPEEIAERLTEAQRVALLQFSSDDELLEAENETEWVLIKEMRNLGIVSEIIAAGHVFMQPMPLGLEVRRILEKRSEQG